MSLHAPIKFFIFSLLCLSWHFTFGQKVVGGGVPVWGADLNPNFIFAHTPDVQRAALSNPMRFELTYAIQTVGIKDWHIRYRYPRYGLGLNYINFFNSSVLGESLGLIAYLEVVNRRKGNFAFNFRVGTGITYLSRPFDVESNRSNLFYSQRLNPTMQGTWNVNFDLRSHLQWIAGLSLTHYSNGSLTHPNKGINIVGVHTGIRYYPTAWKAIKRDQPLESNGLDEIKRWEHRIRLGLSAKRINVKGSLFMVNVGAYWATYRYNSKGSWIVGTELVNSPAIIEESGIDGLRARDILRASIAFGHETHINKLSMLNYAGVYYFAPVNAPVPIYLANGLRYRVSQSISFTWLLRIHRGVADFIEYGVSYTF